ncbi:MAG: FTR1 family protein [Methylophaga sp.]|nr:FTR1 family protein [Methylophaga sp.]
MLINSVILILREVLEAALIVSVFLALSQKLQLSKRWLMPALLFGFATAAIYALNIQVISQAFEGVGQEIVNASLQVVIFGCIALFVFFIKNAQNHKRIAFIMMCCVSMAVTREGAEIIIYIQGLIAIPELRSPVLIGSIIGAGIGISAGVFFYYLIASLSFKNGLRLGLFLLILIAGGMIMQASQLLIQADLISSQQALWNSSSFLNERSLTGQLLYALIGYEATPAPIQVYMYICSLFIMITLTVRTLNHFKQREII